jgi:catechol 2,3-dioxygenase-like lactoylglutathione lyase family enzyme
MQLNHIDLPVPDVAAAARFFIDGFGFARVGPDRPGMAILTVPGMSLVLNEASKPVYPDSFHIGFLQPSEEAVHAVHQRLLAAGIDAPAPSVMHGSLVMFCRAPGGVAVEVSYRGALP